MARGWSQEDLGANANLHRTYIGAIERAEENLTLQTIDKLAKALNVMPAVLIMPQTPMDEEAVKNVKKAAKTKKTQQQQPRMSAVGRRQNYR
jgi:transcriptional regulator with XRE-family HTH domain